MKIRITLLLLLSINFIALFAKNNYIKGIVDKDGYCNIYKAQKPSSTSSENRYGLLDDKKDKIVLPMIYRSVYTSYEEGIYIIKDTLDNQGLFSTKKNKIILEPKYSKIESFSDGVAIVQKEVAGKGKYSYKTYLYGAVNSDGKLILPDTFSFLGKYKDGLIKFKQNGEFGFMNKKGKVAIPATYENAGDFSCGLAAVQSEVRGNYGYINPQNKFVIEPKYVFADNFYKNYATVYAVKRFFGSAGRYDKNKLILIDTNGKELTEPIYETISLKTDGGLFTVMQNEKEGLIDSTGKVILPVEYKSIGMFYHGVSIVLKSADVYGLINTEGKFLLQPEYSAISSANESSLFYAKKDNKFTVYDKNMNVIIPADTARRIILGKKNIASLFENSVKIFDVTGKYLKTIEQENIDYFGVAFFSNDDSIRINSAKTISIYNLKNNTKQNLDLDEITDFNDDGIFVGKKIGKWSFYDYTSKKLFPVSFQNIINFSEGICGLQESTYSTPYLADKSLTKIATLVTVFHGPYSEGLAMSKSQYGSTIYYLNKEGKTQFSIAGLDGNPCKDGRIRIKNNAYKYLYVDKSGKAINTSTYDELGDFYDGLAGFKINKKGGYIDTTGKIIIPANYDDISNFSNGAAIVKVGEEFFQINKSAKSITKDKFTGASDPSNGFFPVKKASGAGLINEKGKTIIDFKYQDVAVMSEDRAWAKKNNKCGLLDNNGTEITPFIYDACTNFDNGYCTVTLDGKYGVMDKTGKLVLPTEYTQMGTFYNNTVLVIKPYNSILYSVKQK